MQWIFDTPELESFEIPDLEHSACAIAVCAVGDHSASLLAEEVTMTETMSAERRLHTFTSGRHCVRMAQQALGQSPTAVKRSKRVPIWAEGYGSITHSDSFAAATVADENLSVGIDLEELGRVEERLWRLIFTEDERANMSSELASIGFSAKEAGYKAIYPLGEKFINFHDAEIDIDMSSQTFRIRYLGDHPPNQALETGIGHFQFNQDHVLTFFSIDQCSPS